MDGRKIVVFIGMFLIDLMNTGQVLDLGSGKGYLSQHLSLRYGLTVVGMDSHGANTDGALKRNRKVRHLQPVFCMV